ncbi:MAG: efflux RND transporter periplasmic adaptor subunit [Planctomycetes bacterium]|nr:efflux RND transporter periplasmic adaptor subunit [Planctomycetota bacterium]
MPPSTRSLLSRTLASLLLFLGLGGVGYWLFTWKTNQQAAAAAAAAAQPEPAQVVTAAEVVTRTHARTTTSIGTARALQSITLRNELPGTVAKVVLATGQIVAPGAVLLELDVGVEQAELKALQAEARLAESMLVRMEQALQNQGASAADVDRARAERDKAAANVVRLEAVIERKRIRAPFQARVGMVDVHVGQYLDPGTTLTTLQGLDEGVHIDFAVTQDAAAALAVGGAVEVTVAGKPVAATIAAIDARVESATRNTWIRALLTTTPAPAPGSSVRVQVPVEPAREVLVVPVSALRRGPAGDHVFMLVNVDGGAVRAQMRRVTAGSTLGDEIIVRDGVKAGERIAAAGSFKLYDGALVQIAAPAPQAK